MKPTPVADPRSVMERSAEKAERISALLAPLLKASMPANEAAEWANAVAMNAGAALSAMHKATGVPVGFDKKAADSLYKYIRLGMRVGRSQ